VSVGEVKKTLMGIGNFGGKKKKGQGQGLLRSYKGLKLLPLLHASPPFLGLLRSYKGLKLKLQDLINQKIEGLLRSYKGLKPGT
jgi:hypothetical protein